MAYPVPTKDFLQPATTDTMRCHSERDTHKPLSTPPFCRREPIFKTDCANW